MSASASTPWGEFSADPRDPATASLRASDRDRDVALRVLGESYADGRLTREEYDERAERASVAKTLGELPPIVADLVPQTPLRRPDEPAPASPEELHDQAVRAYASARRNALSGVVTVSVMLTVIWFAVSGGHGFFWPVFVVAAGLANLLRVLLNKQGLIEEEQQRLERRQRKSLERRQRRSIEPPPGDDGG